MKFLHSDTVMILLYLLKTDNIWRYVRTFFKKEYKL